MPHKVIHLTAIREQRISTRLDAEMQRSEREFSGSRRLFWMDANASISLSHRINHGIFTGCANLNGALPKHVQYAILCYLNNPDRTVADWIKIRSFFITPIHTLWQAWIECDPAAPRRRNDQRMPEPEALIRSIRQIVDADYNLAINNGIEINK